MRKGSWDLRVTARSQRHDLPEKRCHHMLPRLEVQSRSGGGDQAHPRGPLFARWVSSNATGPEASQWSRSASTWPDCSEAQAGTTGEDLSLNAGWE